MPDDYDEPEQIDPNAEAAKQAAFVCLLGLDKDGNEIKSGSPLYHQFKQVAFNALTMLKDNNYNKVYGGSDGKGYNTSRRVILFLQAYDFLKGLEPQNDTVIQIGYLLQSHVRDFFRINKNWPWDVFYRNDNHSLMFAGALGLASVVLHDHSHKSIDKSWHPEQWAHAALWRINRTLWHEEWGKKTESKRGGTYGFGEGYHYFGFSMIECVLPYMLALKNARSDEKLPIPDEFGYDYKPKNILPLTFYPKETVEINLWDDENYTNLFEWYSNSLKPNGYVQMTDDGFPYIGYRGIGIYRNKVNLHYPEEAFSRENFASEIIDVMVAQLEGHFNLYKETLNGHFISDNGEVAIHSYVDRGVEGQDPTNRQLLLHFNVKKDEFFKMYHRDFLGSPHGHYDLSSFTLNAGISNGASGVLATALIPEASSRVSLLKTRMIKPESHNVLLIDGEGPKIESPILVKKDLNDGLGNISYKFFYKNDIELVRQIRIFKDDGFITYEIRDELIGDNLADREVTWQMYTNGHSNGTANLNQTGFKGEFKLEEIADGQYLVNANCATYSDNSVLFNLGVDFDHNFAANQFEISLEDVTVGDEIDIIFHVEKIKFDVANSDDFVLHTTLTPHYCGESVRFPVSVTVTRGGEASAAVQANGNWKTFFSEQEENNGIIFNNPFYFTGFCDSLLTNAKYLRTSIDTSRFDSLLCTAFSPLVKVLMEEGTYLAIDTVEYLRSTSLLRNLHWFNLKKYYYNGNFITTQPFDTLTFYLPEVPPTYLSLMEEKSGLDYSYDTTTQKMTLYLADSGSYHFRFEPSNPCAVSCYYPPVEIVGHFEQVRSHERLGHILSVKADEGWLDMKEGARMNICTKAVLNNADSLTLSSVYGCPRTKSSGTDGLGKTKGFAAHYLNSEGHKYRSSYRVGSGAGLDHDGFSGNDMDKVKGPSNRSMIIVENEGALVLKSGSHTVVGNGSTILVKPGGTLKIENGATVVIGSHDSIGCGYGEIIVMDSAFLCVGSQANVSFYDNSPDTVDKHVLFVSMNPENGAINGIAPTSNAVDTAAECVAFCDFRTTFPEFGVGNYRHGWSNLGKPFAWMEEIGVICYGNDVYANGIYTLNETRYRFEICKYNKVTQQCMEAVDTIPMNDTDNYFGGRLQGRVNLSHLYQTYYPGKDFESGNDYRIRFIIHNDCGLSDEVVEIVEMPDPLTAVVTGDTVTCGGQGAITVNGSASTGEIDSLRWEVWAYKPFPELDSANYFANADTFVA
ncbi:MAG: hypothetical protein HYZ16_03195, partial [Bacteroidetes bacterium]|nr:hypothetical protein [Bacteroidota bacterium]